MEVVPDAFAVGEGLPTGTYPDDVLTADPSGAGHEGTYPADVRADAETAAPDEAAEEGLYPTGLTVADVPGASDGVTPSDFISAWAGDVADPSAVELPDTP